MRDGRDYEQWPVMYDKVMVFEHLKYNGQEFGLYIDHHNVPKIVFKINCNPEWTEAYEAFKKQKEEEDNAD